ncbi:hypothetical protein N8469_00695 [bacterium]|jgi:hypothetical protein|nr:hypothetical protein [bacterium]|tara:strand:- start:35 stop:523 length:489 start_codon:yes stop_codon:yes gene_type:complete
MKNTIWQQVQPGQIVSFLYKSKNSSRAEKRTVLCIDPEYTYRKKSTKRNVKLFVGLQLETTLRGPINARTLDQAFRLLGGAKMDRGVAEIGNFEDSMDDTDVELIYTRLKRFVKKHDVFRTFFLRECRKRRVYLIDNYKRMPPSQSKKLILEQNLEKLTNES